MRKDSLLREFLPPVLLNALRKVFKRDIIFRRGYPSWEQAQAECIGYDSEQILQKLTESTTQVITGKAAYERDGVLFDEIHYSWPVLTSLLFASKTANDCFRVLDFGGSLGSSFRQNRKFFDRMNQRLDWRIVEQSEVAEIGSSQFSNSQLSFYKGVREAKGNGFDVALFASSICYVPSPYEILNEVLEQKPEFLIFDRTPFSEASEDSFALQINPSSIVKSSYPIRIFSEKKLFRYLEEQGYRLIESWKCDIRRDPGILWRGFFLERKAKNS